MQEQDCVESGDVNALRQASRVAQDAAYVGARVLLEPVEPLASLPGILSAVDMLHLADHVVAVGVAALELELRDDLFEFVPD